MDLFRQSTTKLSNELDKVPSLRAFQANTGIDKVYLVLAVALTLFLFVFFGFGANLICNIVGFIYPAYSSFKAIESDTKAGHVQWLTYWVVYACFNVIEVFSDILLAWIPLYYPLKLGFLFWLFMPSTQGANFIYFNLVAPFLKTNEACIDEALKEAMSCSGKVFLDISGMMRDVGRDVTKTVAMKIVESSIEVRSPKAADPIAST
uniref:Uncharacterized protein AlNc14C37G3243 n=1 Tax=Albugo laibachii Nc14 TaxID=890382 RepID=F0W8W8_9STRA|nr:conserved hypothetical protein [Albugo laibachii Nc14]|eukprot:CCA17579.1 conserved hypothetical protein [Albugo laibachii Nc14]